MPIPVLVLALLTYLVSASAPAMAQGNEPVVYLFWAQSCPYSQRTMAFIQKLRRTDPKLQIKDYEVEGSPANAAAHERVLERIGITGVNLVPLTVVGENVLVGFESDEISGTKIEDFVQQCRSLGCPDRMSDLVPGAGTDWAVTTLAPVMPSCSNQTRVMRISAPTR